MKTNPARKWIIPGLITLIGLILVFVASWQYQMLSQVRSQVKTNLENELAEIGHAAAEQMTDSLEGILKKSMQPGIDYLSQVESINEPELAELDSLFDEIFEYSNNGFLALYDTSTQQISVLQKPSLRQTKWLNTSYHCTFLENRFQAYQGNIFGKTSSYWQENVDNMLVIQSLAIYQRIRYFCIPFFKDGRTRGLLCLFLDQDRIENYFMKDFFTDDFIFPLHQMEQVDEKYLQFGLRNALGQLTFHSVVLGNPNFETRIELDMYSPLFAGYNLDVGFRNTSSSEIANAVYNRNIWLWAGLGLLWMILAGFLIHTAYQANRLIRLKSAFVANVSHEFKTPLTSIRMAHDTLAQGRFNDKEDVQKIAAHIGTETQRLEKLVYRLLDFGRLESGHSPWKMESIQLDDWIVTLQQLAAQKAQEKDFTITCRFSTTGVTLMADITALEQVVLILLDNAFKYAAAEPQVDLVGSISGNYFQLEVRDFGPGIPAGDQKQVFERFTRLGDPDRHDVKGFGLGLSIATEIAKAHKGKLSFVRPKDGIGSIFRLEIPVVESHK